MTDTYIANHKYDFKDSKQTIAFLKTKFNKKRYIKKSSKLLWQLILINKYHPKIINDIIDNLNELTCWKSYFLLLLTIHNQKNKENNTVDMFALDRLETRIYNLLAAQYLKDVELYNSGDYCEVINNSDVRNAGNYVTIQLNGKQSNTTNTQNKRYITTLAKWLPSKRSTINKKLKFYNHFVPLVSYENYAKGMNSVSVNIKQLKQVLGVTDKVFNECKLTEQPIINFNKLSRLAIGKHIKDIQQNQTLSTQYIEYLVQKYESYDLFKIITLLRYNHTLDEYCKIALERVWNNNSNKYSNDLIKYYGINLLDYDMLLVDLSKNIINDKYKMRIVIVIVILACSLGINVSVIGSDQKISFNDSDNIIKKYKMVATYVAPCRQDNVFREQISRTCSIILVDKLGFKNFGSSVYPDSLVWELENNNKKLKTTKYPKFTKVQGIINPNEFTLINNILNNHEWTALFETLYKYFVYIMAIAFLIIAFVTLIM